jgi:hypothetical protein
VKPIVKPPVMPVVRPDIESAFGHVIEPAVQSVVDPAVPVSSPEQLSAPPELRPNDAPASFPVMAFNMWHRISVLNLGPEPSPHAMMSEFAIYGLYAARWFRIDGREDPLKNIDMLFKVAVQRDEVAQILRDRGLELTTDLYEDPGISWGATCVLLPYVQELFRRNDVNIPMLLSIAPPPPDPATYHHQFLRYDANPPSVLGHSPPDDRRERRRTMSIIAFDADWLRHRAALEDNANSDIDLQRFIILCCAHIHMTRQYRAFYVPIWPAAGPMNRITRTVGRWAYDAMVDRGETISTVVKVQETFGYHWSKKKGIGRFELHIELNLPAPRYILHPLDRWDVAIG